MTRKEQASRRDSARARRTATSAAASTPVAGAIDLAALGIDRDEIINRIIEQCVERVLDAKDPNDYDDDGDGGTPRAHRYAFENFRIRLESLAKQRADKKVDALFESYVFPHIDKFITELTLQRTNQYGEPKGEPFTFVEYLTQRADAYLREPVNFQGKTKGEDSYNWRESTTRITYLIDSYMQYSIKTAMEGALKKFDDTLKDAIVDAIKIAADNIVAGAKLVVERKGK